jgi:transcriptional regulator with XRE-family HTH domain
VPTVDSDPGQRERYEAERQQILEAFGLKLALRRKTRPRLSQEAVARLADLHRTQISALERGERNPSLLTLMVLARAYGVQPAELLTDLPKPTERKPKRKRKAAARKASPPGIPG